MGNRKAPEYTIFDIEIFWDKILKYTKIWVEYEVQELRVYSFIASCNFIFYMRCKAVYDEKWLKMQNEYAYPDSAASIELECKTCT